MDVTCDRACLAMVQILEALDTTCCAGLLITTKAIMAAPLPRVFEESAGGKAVPVPTAPGQNGNIGGDFRADELVRVSKDTVSAPSILRMRASLSKLSPKVPSCLAPHMVFAKK